MLVELIHIARERKRHNIGLKAIDHRAGLLAGAAVRLLDGDVIARLRFPVLGKGDVVVLIKFASRIIGDIKDRDVGRICTSGKDGDSRRKAECQGRAARQTIAMHELDLFDWR
jgi:hypothetical protein